MLGKQSDVGDFAELRQKDFHGVSSALVFEMIPDFAFHFGKLDGALGLVIGHFDDVPPDAGAEGGA